MNEVTYKFDCVFTSSETIHHPNVTDSNGRVVAFGGITTKTYDDKGLLIDTVFIPQAFTISYEEAAPLSFLDRFMNWIKQ